MWIPETLSLSQISERSQRLLIGPLVSKLGDNFLMEHGIRFQDLYEHVILPRFGITIEENANLSHMCGGKGALGAYFPETNSVKMSVILSPDLRDPRRVFTLYHEVCGHGVLQGRWLRAQLAMPGRSDVLEDDDTSIDIHNASVLERQANAMAAMTAAPMKFVNAQLILRLRPRPLLCYTRPSWYQFGSGGRLQSFWVGSFEEYTRALAKMIHPWFHGLSVEALSYRVRRSQIVKDRSSPLALARAI